MMKKKINVKMITLGCLCVVMLISACGTKEPTLSPDQILTSVVMTVESDFTKTAIARPTETPTLAPTATNTPVPPTPTLASTVPTSGTIVPTAVGGTLIPSGGADKGEWVSSVPADNTKVIPGQKFSVMLTFINNGTSTWTTSYGLKFVSGTQMEAADFYPMPIQVPPTKLVQVEIQLTAPQTAGLARGDWSLVNAAGDAFGVFYVQYEVVAP